ncbi:hypothetical protein V6N12_005613 [Hibiscus sabdariffa]|uniref:RNase H type-1 domain-containing protein n=1 Tax=Hibiscus sabdariffa TaxID=183260 RepID=A0ABR2BB39_9ROSI
MVQECGDWDWNRLEGILPQQSLECIASIYPLTKPWVMIYLAKGVWSRVIPPGLEGSLFSRPFHLWFKENLLVSGASIDDEEWPSRFVEEFRWAKARQIVSVNASESEIQWKRPPLGWVKLNVDASVSLIDNRVGIGVAFQDSDGKWIWGVARSVGRCNVLLAELWAIHDGLLHAWLRGYRQIVVESDCLEAVHIVKSVTKVMQESALVASIKGWLARDWQVELYHIGRGRNQVADRITARSCNSESAAMLLPLPPMEIRGLVEEEMHNSN